MRLCDMIPLFLLASQVPAVERKPELFEKHHQDLGRYRQPYPVMMPAIDWRETYPEMAWLVGLTEEEVIARLGPPTNQNMGGVELLLDYQSASCDFSVFLVPNSEKKRTVRYFLPLNKDGETVDLRACLKEVFPPEKLERLLQQSRRL